MWYRCSVDVVVVVVEGKQLKCGGGSGGGGGGGKITNKLTRSRLGESIISIESKIRCQNRQNKAAKSGKNTLPKINLKHRQK